MFGKIVIFVRDNPMAEKTIGSTKNESKVEYLKFLRIRFVRRCVVAGGLIGTLCVPFSGRSMEREPEALTSTDAFWLGGEPIVGATAAVGGTMRGVASDVNKKFGENFGAFFENDLWLTGRAEFDPQHARY